MQWGEFTHDFQLRQHAFVEQRRLGETCAAMHDAMNRRHDEPAVGRQVVEEPMHTRFKVGHLFRAAETLAFSEAELRHRFRPEAFYPTTGQAARSGTGRDLHYIELERGAAAVDDENIH